MSTTNEQQAQLPFALVKPIVAPPRTSQYSILSNVRQYEEVSWLIDERPADEFLFIDLETRGTEAHKSPDEQYVVGVSVSDSRGAAYISVKDCHPDIYKHFILHLFEAKVPLVAHNVAFDASFLTRDLNLLLDITNPQEFVYHNWKLCTLVQAKALSNEGFLQQSWGLKNLQVNLLGWESKGDVELDKWLTENGHTNNQGNVQKGEMWRAPAEILGHYACMDADATYLLWNKVLAPVYDRFRAHQKITEYFMTLILTLVRQQLTGMRIDLPRLRAYSEELETKIEETKAEFFEMPRIKPLVEARQAKTLQELLFVEPARYKKQKELCAEPKKFNINGTLSKTWEKWEQKRLNPPPLEESSHWTRWNKKLEELKEQKEFFNLNSALDKREIFYESLGYPVLLFTDSEDNPQPSVDSDAMRGFGEEGKLLIHYSELVKLKGYVDAYIEKTDPVTSLLHVKLKPHGTLTGRCSGGGGGINIQQVPKDRGFLECLIPREGHVWVDFDFAALEPHVLAEASQDESLLALYGPGAKQNDIYLFTGAGIPGLKESILATGYDPRNPTPETISKAKKECKKVRQICKLVTLSSQYGAGPNKIRQTLSLEGIEMSLDEVRKIHQGYWNLYGGVKRYEKFLQAQWERNGGWVLSPIGTPICIDRMYIKDIINRNIQNSGHSILLIGLSTLITLLDHYGVPWNPIVADYHDEVLFEVPEEYAEKAVELVGIMFEELNKVLNSTVKLKGDTVICRSLADAKLED